jgi:ribosomal protein S6--L-glutamate ligase
MKILILSRDETLYSTIKLKEACIKRGHEVLVVDSFDCNLGISDKPIFFHPNAEIENFDAIIPRVGALSVYSGVSLVKHFEEKQIFSTATSEGILQSHDKFRTFQALLSEKIRLPKTVFINSLHGLENNINFVGGVPFVIKILEGTQGLGVILAETQNTAISVIETLYRTQTKFLIQEYVKESSGTDIRAFVVGDKVVASMKRIGQKGDFRSNIHRGGVGERVKLTSEEQEIAIKSALKMKLGVAGIDILRSHLGPMLLEVNSSPGLEGIEFITKIDIAAEIIKYIEKNAK